MTIKKTPFARNRLIRDAISKAIYDEMKLDPSVYLFGEGAWVKQKYDAPKILEEFPNRIVTLPISEDGNTNFAVGTSLLGIKPVVDVITADFLYRAMDSICNTAAKLNFVALVGEPPKTIVIRAEFLTGGPTTGQRLEALFTHIPGLNVVIPSTPRDAYGLMKTALNTPGVTIFFEDRMIQDELTTVSQMEYDADTVVPFGSAFCKCGGLKPGLAIITYGLMRQVVDSSLEQEGWNDITVIDLRSLYPIDWDTLVMQAIIHKKVLIVEPDVTYGGIGAEIAATLPSLASRTLWIERLGAPRCTIPAASALHPRMLPTQEDIIAKVKQMGGHWAWTE